jgi:hypothetical protein
MLFQASITIPKNTISGVPVMVILGIAQGVITKIIVHPHPGHAGLAHCIIQFQGTQISPSTTDMDFRGDTFPIEWDEYLPIDQPPLELEILGWNEDDTYEHTFDIYVAMQPANVVAKQGALGNALNKFLKMVGINA